MGNCLRKDLYPLRILMNFLCIYLGEGKGGGALMQVYVWEHMVSLPPEPLDGYL